MRKVPKSPKSRLKRTMVAKSTTTTKVIKLQFIRRNLIFVNKQRLRKLYYVILGMLGVLLISVCCIVLWEIQIGVDLMYYQYLFGLFTTVAFPSSVGVAVLFLVLLPTLIATKALFDIGVKEYAARGTRLIYFTVWFMLLTAIVGLIYVAIKFLEVYDTNQRLKRTLLRFSYLYAHNDKETVIELNDLHEKYQCCGVENVTSWLELYNWHPLATLAVPHSCCRPDYNGPCYHIGVHVNYTRTEVIKSIYLRGCRKLLNRYFRQTVRPVLFWLAVIFLWEAIIVFALLIFVQNYIISKKYPIRKVIKRKQPAIRLVPKSMRSVKSMKQSRKSVKQPADLPVLSVKQVSSKKVKQPAQLPVLSVKQISTKKATQRPGYKIGKKFSPKAVSKKQLSKKSVKRPKKLVVRRLTR